LPPDSCTTFNVSQDGLHLATLAGHYVPGAKVYVITDFQPGSPINYAMEGVVVRVERLERRRKIGRGNPCLSTTILDDSRSDNAAKDGCC
jgi:hypothetical protein